MLSAPRPHDIYNPAPPSVLVIPDRIWRAMVDHALAAQPNESVGLLAATGDGRALVAAAWFPGTNVDASPMRYTMDCTEVEVAVERMARSGWTLGAIVHSHPDDPAVPSETDRREYRYPNALMGIISLAAAHPDLRMWALRQDRSGAARRMAEIAVRTVAQRTTDEEHW